MFEADRGSRGPLRALADSGDSLGLPTIWASGTGEFRPKTRPLSMLRCWGLPSIGSCGRRPLEYRPAPAPSHTASAWRIPSREGSTRAQILRGKRPGPPRARSQFPAPRRRIAARARILARCRECMAGALSAPYSSAHRRGKARAFAVRRHRHRTTASTPCRPARVALWS